MAATTTTPQKVRDAAYGLTIPSGSNVDKAIQRLIDKAEDRIAVAFPNLDARLAADEVPQGRVDGVVEDMVIRVLRNPGGTRQVSIDDYTRMIDAALSSGALYISPEERALLEPRRRRAGRSIRVGVPPWRIPGA